MGFIILKTGLLGVVLLILCIPKDISTLAHGSILYLCQEVILAYEHHLISTLGLFVGEGELERDLL